MTHNLQRQVYLTLLEIDIATRWTKSLATRDIENLSQAQKEIQLEKRAAM